MSLNCPHCGFLINPKSPKPGRFQPKCPKCGQSFLLSIPTDVSQPWQVEKLPTPKLEVLSDSPGVTALRQRSSLSASEPIARTRHKSRPGEFDKTEVPVGPTKIDAGNDATVMGNSPRPEVSVEEPSLPKLLGGYEIQRELGHGGMGSVYLARQISLDRSVALKIMNPKWAEDRVFLSRFTREAYAAAQLVHHNVVQIYDIGEEKGFNFFSMEFVDGRSLGDLVKKNGKMPPKEAIGLILQAARGLQFAHDRGMIHRDVKPDNLMLNKQGIVKVADLGLVKTPGMSKAHDAKSSGPKVKLSKSMEVFVQEVTQAHTAMGSPAYMSPEQCRDASQVDLRADIYSLGCTLYVLLTGRPPFSGETALEVMSKHAFEDPIPPDQIVKEVPAEVSNLLMRMIAKSPDDRYPSMKELIEDFELYLIGDTGKESTPEQDTSELQGLAQQFNSVPAVKHRKLALLSFALVGTLGSLLLLFSGSVYGLALLLTIFQTVLAYFLLQGIREKTYLFSKVREWLFGSRFIDWLTYLAGAALLVFASYLTGMLALWIGSLLLAGIWAFAFYFLFDNKINSVREPIIEAAEKILRGWRMQGREESELQLLVAQTAGRHWEEFYEALFGYESKLAMRTELGEQNPQLVIHRYATWREPIINRIQSIQNARKAQREKKFLEKVEVQKLEAEGFSRADARVRAEAQADRMVEKAEEVSKGRKAIRMNDFLEDEEVPAKRAVKPLSMKIEETIGSLVGPKVRFLLAALLIAGGCLWIRENLNEFKANLPNNLENPESALRTFLEATENARPLQLSLLPNSINGLFTYFNPLVAGLLLLLSLGYRGRIMSICFLAGSGIAFVGHKFGIPGVMGVKPEVISIVVGCVISIFGYLMARRERY